jgi:hypothetical protein
MPIHDWTRVPSELFHDFHQTWTIQLKIALNSGRLPKGLFALVEQRAGAKEPHVLTIESKKKKRPATEDGTLPWKPASCLNQMRKAIASSQSSARKSARKPPKDSYCRDNGRRIGYAVSHGGCHADSERH